MARPLALSWTALLAALGLACHASYVPPPIPLSDEAVREAGEVLSAAAERRGDLRLEEGGLVLDAYVWTWRESLARYDLEDWSFDEPTVHGLPRSERERVLEGPRTLYVRLEDLLEVRVRQWALGSGIELTIARLPEAALLETRDREEAEELALALDVLRRAWRDAR